VPCLWVMPASPEQERGVVGRLHLARYSQAAAVSCCACRAPRRGKPAGGRDAMRCEGTGVSCPLHAAAPSALGPGRAGTTFGCTCQVQDARLCTHRSGHHGIATDTDAAAGAGSALAPAPGVPHTHSAPSPAGGAAPCTTTRGCPFSATADGASPAVPGLLRVGSSRRGSRRRIGRISCTFALGGAGRNVA
jgi:hypothetical protein